MHKRTQKIKASAAALLLLPGLLLSLPACSPAADRITIDVSREGAEVPASLYGVFFEEITHSGDGGLYAEMLMNRGFEDGNLPSGTTYKDEIGRAHV